MGVLYGHKLPPLGIGLNVQPERKLRCSAPFFFLSVGKKSGPMNVRVFLVVAVAVILLFKNAEAPGAFLRHQVGGPSRRRAGSSPWTSCRNLSRQSSATSGAGTTRRFRHFDMVWASPVCTEYSRALTTRPRRLLEGDALVLSALEIIAHFDPLMWVIENPATGLLKIRPFMERLPWVDVTYCKYGTPYRKQTEAEPVQAQQLLQGVAGRQAPPGRAAGAAADGEGQPIARAALQRSCRAVRGDCARGHGGACGAAEHSGLILQASSNPTSLEEAHFSMFLLVFWAVPLNFKNEEEGHPRPFSRFWAHSKAVSRFIKNDET